MSSAQVKITQLPAAGPITGTESVPIVQNGLTVQTTTGAIAASPSQTQTFVTVNQESTLPNSRYLSTGVGLGLTDGGAQSFYRFTLNAASGSLETAGTGIVVKTNSSTVAARTITATSNGVSVTNGSGVAGDPQVSLSGTVLALANLASTGMLSIGGGSVNARTLYGTADQIDVTNGTGTADPVFSIATDPVIPGVGGLRIPQGTTAQRPPNQNGWIRYNTDSNGYEVYENGSWSNLPTGAVTLINTGTGLTGGPITTTGTISLSVPVLAANGGTGFTSYAVGDVTYASGAATLSKLALGTQGFVLTAGATGPVWSGISGGTF